ncbi:hypothetical protein CLAFUR4_02186 [Fulvia fulva]|nr:hypothetical protein CLAFUR4_02186 [Fulvia fulva]
MGRTPRNRNSHASKKERKRNREALLPTGTSQQDSESQEQAHEQHMPIDVVQQLRTVIDQGNNEAQPVGMSKSQNSLSPSDINSDAIRDLHLVVHGFPLPTSVSEEHKKQIHEARKKAGVALTGRLNRRGRSAEELAVRNRRTRIKLRKAATKARWEEEEALRAQYTEEPMERRARLCPRQDHPRDNFACDPGLPLFHVLNSNGTDYNIEDHDRASFNQMTTVTKPIITTAVRGTAGREWLTSVAQSPRLLDFVVANSPHMQSVLLLAIAQAESDLELHSQPAHAFATAAELLDEDVHPAWLQEPSETEMAERDVQEGTRLVFLNDLKMLYLKVTGFKPREDALQPYRKVTAINKEVLQKWHDTVVAHALARAAEPKVDELPPPPPKIDIPYLPISSFVNLSQDACPFDQLSQQDQSIVTRLKEGRGRRSLIGCVASAAYMAETNTFGKAMALAVMADVKEIYKFCAGREVTEEDLKVQEI